MKLYAKRSTFWFLPFTFCKIQANLYNLQNFYRNLPNSKIKLIENYGCWCNFNQITTGHSQPVNLLDAACKQLHDNYKCILNNFEFLNQNCDPDTVEYVFDEVLISDILESNLKAGDSTLNQNSKTELLNYCENVNVESCTVQACQADLAFMFEIHDFVVGAVNLDVAFSHVNGFTCAASTSPSDAMGNVAVQSLPGDSAPSQQNLVSGLENDSGTGASFPVTMQCCGSLPNYIIYHPSISPKACCQAANALYNPATEICEGEYVVSLTSDLDLDELVVNMSDLFKKMQRRARRKQGLV